MHAKDFELPPRAEIQRLYDDLRFLDAHARTESLWSRPDVAEKLSANELVLAGRLSSRLGHSKLARRLFHLASQRAPDDEEVRYFARFTQRVRTTVLDQLREMDRGDAYSFKDPAMAASTMVSDAMVWSSVRCFDVAFELCKRALELHAERAWVHSCCSVVHLSADQVEKALECAEQAWSIQPGVPHAASALVHVLQRMERDVEAAERLWTIWPVTQSFEVACLLLHAASTVAERQPDLAAVWEPRAAEVLDRLPRFAPLGGRGFRDWLDGMQRNAALNARERSRLLLPLPASEEGGFWSAIAARTASAPPDATLRLLPHRPARQRHNTCLPASLATVTHASGLVVDEDELERELSFGGTNVWRSAEWLQKRGHAVRFCRYSADVARGLLDAGVPFVLLFAWDTSGHATAAVGYDDLTGTLIVHDPSQPRLRRMLIDRVGEEEMPVGPEIMAVVPAARAEVLDRVIPQPERRLRGLMIEHAQALDTGGAATASAVAGILSREFPDNPQTEFVQSMQDALSGRTAVAAKRLKAMAAKWPDCAAIRRLLFNALEREGHLGRLREGLRDLIERGRLPGVEMGRRWVYPPSYYAGRYAELLSRSADGVAPAWAVLRRTLRYAWADAGLYNTAGWMLLRERKLSDAILPFMVAAQLAEERHDFARKVADILRLLNREEEGLAYLRDRAARLQATSRGRSAWIAVVEALEDYGWPDRALAELRQALADDASGVLSGYAVAFFARHGFWAEAGEHLEGLRSKGGKLEHLRSTVWLMNARGCWADALTAAEEWLREAPDDMEARRLVLDGIACRDGHAVACEQARAWMREFPAHDEIEMMLLGRLDAVKADAEALELLRARVARNPDDAWAWRELAHRAMSTKSASAAEIEAASRQAQRVAPHAAATSFLLARRLERDGHFREAIEQLCEGLRLEPENYFGYTRVCDLLPRLPKDGQDAILLRLEELFTHTTGQWHGARPLAMRIAAYRGMDRALEAVDRWLTLRPRDPEVMEARADLLLQRGQGKSDARRALPGLEEAARTFPTHLELRLSLALAYHILEQYEDEERVLSSLLEQHPANADVCQRLAYLLHLLGRHDEALKLLQRGIDISPLHGDLRIRRADSLWRTGKPVEALAVLRQACKRLPEHDRLREFTVARLIDFSQFDEAQQLATEAVERYPGNAEAWVLLARAYDRNPGHTEVADLIAALRRALSIDPSNFEASDMLAQFLGQQQQFAEAVQVVEQALPHLGDPAPARARLAWLQRRRGDRREAVAAMRAMLASAPWHLWGWRCLLDWLHEDQDHALTREILEDYWPAELADEAPLRAQRLELLAEAKVEARKLDQEWARLLADFPNDHVLLNTRFDQLWAANLLAEAAKLLEGRIGPSTTNPFLLARHVKVLAWQQRRVEALDVAMKIWLMPDQDSGWAQNAAWDAIGGDEAASRIVAALDNDFQPGLAAFERMTSHIARYRPDAVTRRSSLLASLLSPGPHRVLRRLLARLDRITWDAARHRAVILSRLDDIGHSAWVVHLWKRNRARWSDETVIWQQAAHAALNARSRHRVRLLAEWRNREGCEMFIVSNLTIALGVTRAGMTRMPWARIADEAAASLERLRHDHTARFLTCNLGCALLALGKYDAFLAMMDRYRPYVADLPAPPGRFWTRARNQHTHDFLRICEQVIRPGNVDVAGLRREVSAFIARQEIPLWADLLFEQVVLARRPALVRPVHLLGRRVLSILRSCGESIGGSFA